ncbi:global transactivator [Fusarium flagelliforme]|uniref:Global transactivator n=1 Tax=Fusarium flagelliforme TaxID=2675880 RepID=A0A395MNB1_9HYPO|nr:global transactivator [Fusarium flagelliforme]
MSGTHIDNTWMGGYAMLSLLRGYDTASPSTMKLASTGHEESYKAKGRGVPFLTYQKISRMIQMMDAITLRRPATIVTSNLPPLYHQLQSYKFETCYTSMSNAQLDEFLRRRKDDGLYNAFAYSMRARHYAYHPLLLELRDIETRRHLASMTRDEALGEALLGEYAESVAKWRKLVNKRRNWESTRTVALIDVMRAHLKNHTDDAFIIMDESVFFCISIKWRPGRVSPSMKTTQTETPQMIKTPQSMGKSQSSATTGVRPRMTVKRF